VDRVKRRSPKEFVGALYHGLRVLQTFSPAKPSLTLSQVAKLADVSPATARRALLTLSALGFVKSSNRRFSLSARILLLSSGYPQQRLSANHPAVCTAVAPTRAQEVAERQDEIPRTKEALESHVSNLLLSALDDLKAVRKARDPV
jgi:hypothetical protein